MTRRLSFNPGQDPVTYLEAVNHGQNRINVLDQLLISLRAEAGRPNHQHHLLIGPRGSGKTHLLRILTAGRIPSDPTLSKTYLPLVMPEEIPLRTPGDLILKFVERLAGMLQTPPQGIEIDQARQARTQCLTALTTAKALKNPLDRLALMTETLESAAETLDRIILPIAENLDLVLYLGAARGRKNPLEEQWALRRFFQESSRLLLIGAAPARFGAMEDPGKAFFDFFRTHYLDELSNDEVLEIIRLRLIYEKDNPGDDDLRRKRIISILDHFKANSPKLRGLLAITGGLPRFTHLVYEVIVDTDSGRMLEVLQGFLDELTPYFQTRLDPRIIPQPEIDVLHTLAASRGPLQPSEITEELYGVPGNEVSELLNRLQERGLVKRAGRPGGQAVTWDLTEPLYRVWTSFRLGADSRDLYEILAKFVAVLFSLPEIDSERKNLAEKLAVLPEEHVEKTKIASRHRLLECAYNEATESKIRQSRIKAQTVKLFEALINAFNNKDSGEYRRCLDKLRSLSRSHPNDDKVREALAKGLLNAFNNACKNDDLQLGAELLEELRKLSQAHPNDDRVREELVKGLFNAGYHAGKADDLELNLSLLRELIDLSEIKPNENIDEIATQAVMIYGLAVLKQASRGKIKQAKAGMQKLEARIPSRLSEFLQPLNLALTVIENGEEKALAREPEEMRRVVRMLLEQVDDYMP